MEPASGRPLLLLVESDPAVRRAIEAAGREEFRLHYAEGLNDRLLEREWNGGSNPPDVALVEVRETGAASLGRLSRFRGACSRTGVVLTVCYGSDYQLAAERLRALSDAIVFRPFDVDAVVRTLLGLATVTPGRME